MNYFAILVLVFALVFACIEAWKGATTARPANFGWLALALLIFAQLFFRTADILVK